MNEASLIRDVSRTLESRLPPGWRQKLLALRPTDPDRPGATLEITSPDGVKARLVVEAKNRVFPRDVAALKSRLAQYSSGPSLVVAPFLAPSTRRRLQEESMNYADTTGNVRLVLERPGVYIETPGANTDPSPGDAPPFAPASPPRRPAPPHRPAHNRAPSWRRFVQPASMRTATGPLRCAAPGEK